MRVENMGCVSLQQLGFTDKHP